MLDIARGQGVWCGCHGMHHTVLMLLRTEVQLGLLDIARSQGVWC